MKIARAVLAAPVGFAVTLGLIRLLSSRAGSVSDYSTSMNYFLLSLTCTVLAAMIGGYITALVAGAHEFPHAAGLGMLMIAMSVLSMREVGATIPGWYETSIAGCGPMSAMIGAALRLLTKRRPSPVPNHEPAARPPEPQQT
jgi:hypothetical protein